MAAAAIALALHLGAGLLAAPPVATREPKPVEAQPPRAEFDAAFLLAFGTPTTPGLAVRGRLRLVAGLWAHAGVSARAGTAPVAGGVREIPFELGLGYGLPIGSRVRLGVRAEALVMSRQMAVARAGTQHRWLGALRGGLETRVLLTEEVGFTLLVGAEARLGRTEVNVAGVGSATFTPVAPYFELGPSITF